MRQERLDRCDPTPGSGLSPELSSVPVGSQWGQIKVCWGLMGEEGASHRLRGAAQKPGLCHGPLCVLQTQQSCSCLSHVAWAGAECPGDCRDLWDQARALQGRCSWCHTRDVRVLGTHSRAFPAAAKE